MRWIAAGVSFVNFATVSGLLLGMAGHGLNRSIAAIALLLGMIAALFAYLCTLEHAVIPADLPAVGSSGDCTETAPTASASASRYRQLWFWALAFCFAIYAVRSFCWLLYLDSNEWKVQSPNNLGDLALHLTYIENFAHGVALWPDNPIYVFSKLRYPAGIDFFNALFACLKFDTVRGLVVTGLLASAASCWALYRWGGIFGLAGFLFNGGLAGFRFLYTWKFLDYQGDKSIAWKSIPLAMFTTQRGFLYAIPAGLLLLCHWRSKYFGGVAADPDGGSGDRPRRNGLLLLPFWVELSIYATMPLFHVHTFMALSIVAAFLFLIGDNAMRKQLGTLVGAAFVPATFFVWMITDHFQARSMIEWKPGWVQNAGDFIAKPFTFSFFGFSIGTPASFNFWLLNFGITAPLILLLLGVLCYRTWRSSAGGEVLAAPTGIGQQTTAPRSSALVALKPSAPLGIALLRSSPVFPFVFPATLIFLFAYLFKTAPWEWDNTKLIIWAYLIILPFLWSELISRWPEMVRVGVCIALFGSGFVSLLGGLAAGQTGFTIADRAEIDAVGNAVSKLPIEARFACYPTYNHPLLLQGRKVVMGYPGHLWTQGFEYADTSERLTRLMLGAEDWREAARFLRVRYLFWGREEKNFYPTSQRPWEQESRLVNKGDWGAIYDLEKPASRLGD